MTAVGLPPAPPWSGPALDDRAAVVLAVAAGAGAWLARPVPLVPAAVGVVAALAWRRPWLLCLAVLVLASALGARSWAGLVPASPAAFSGRVTLVTDPVDAYGGVRAVVRAGGRRLELTARDGDGGLLRSRLAGEEMVVTGRIRPPPPRSDWFALRHVVGRLDADDVRSGGPGAAPWRLGNQLRRTLVDGAASMSPGHRSLFTGLVLGDDRDQSPELADDFRGAGLAHLTAVSGENLAFVLVLAGPLLRRLAFRGRWAVTLLVVCGFALVTRFEPSVLRASAMAAVAVTASCLGREADALRVLALAVTGLLLVDPFLVRSVGFQLSVAASAGIVVWSRRLATAVPLPRPVAEAVGVTAAAQVAVAPILVAVFGGVPAVSVPANLLAAPAAGPVMMWGLSGGLLAGALGDPWARWLHLPTTWLVGWIDGVARVAARAPLGELGAGELAVVAVGVAGVRWARRRDHRRLVQVSGALVLLGMVTPAVVLRSTVPPVVAVADGATVHRGGGATVVVLESARVRADDLLEGLRRAGVRRIDVLAVRGGGPATVALVAAVRHRWRPARVLAPVGHAVPGARTPRPGTALSVGGLTVTAERPPHRGAAASLVVRIDHHRDLATGSTFGTRAVRTRSAQAPAGTGAGADDPGVGDVAQGAGSGQGDSAPAPSAAGDARPEHPGGPSEPVDQQVDHRRRRLEVGAQAGVAGRHRGAGGGEVFRRDGLGEVPHPGVLGHDVARSPPDHRVGEPFDGVEVGETERSDLGLGHRQLAHPVAVARGLQRPRPPGDEHDPFGLLRRREGDGAHGDRVAVEH